MYDISKKEEGEIVEYLRQTGVVEPLDGREFRALCPREGLGQVTRFVDTQRHEKKQGNGYPRAPSQFALKVGKKIIEDKHPQQGDSKPVTTLHGRVEVDIKTIPEVRPYHGVKQQEEHHCGDNLNFQLLAKELSKVAEVPHL